MPNKRAVAERGELRSPLPVGFIHDDAGDIVIDPDAEVQAAIADVFAAFTACGSAYGVVAASVGRLSRCAPRRVPGPGSCAGVRSPTPARSGY